MPWFSIFLESFPEAIVVFSMGLVLIGYNIKENLKYIAVTALTFSLISFFIRSLPIPFGIHAVIQIIIAILLVKFIIKIKLRTASLVLMTGIIFLFIGEAINLLLFSKLSGFSIEKISTDSILRTFVPYIHLSFLSLVIIFIQKKKITILPLLYRLQSKKSRTNIIFTFFILVLVILTLILYITLFILRRGPVNLIQVNEGIRVLNILIFIFLLSTFFVVKKLINMTENQAILETQEIYLKNLNDLHNSLRSLRHDFINQIQVIYALLNNNNFEEAKKYLSELCNNLTALNKFSQTRDPVITALIQTKMALAEAMSINFDVNIETCFKDLPLSSFELTRILGNLLDNAFEATEVLPAEKRKVKMTAKAVDNYYLIEISNTGLPIPENIIKRIFDSGITTKDNHSGLGLSIVKKLLNKYKGEIGVKSNESETVFTVIIPFKRG